MFRPIRALLVKLPKRSRVRAVFSGGILGGRAVAARKTKAFTRDGFPLSVETLIRTRTAD
jgi:hypothetical protein